MRWDCGGVRGIRDFEGNETQEVQIDAFPGG